MNNSIWGGDYNKTKERWQDAQNKAEGHYDSVERIYQLESLQSKWEDTAQQQLNDLMTNQLEALSQRTTLSEIDVESSDCSWRGTK